MKLTEAFTLRVAIPEPVDYGDTPWGRRIFIAAGEGRLESDRLRANDPYWTRARAPTARASPAVAQAGRVRSSRLWPSLGSEK